MKAGYWARLKHFFLSRCCLTNAEWIGNELRCAMCEAPIAIIGLDNGTSKPYYIFKYFRKYVSEIEGLINERTRERSDLVTDRDSGWASIHDYIKNTCGSLSVLLMEDGGGAMEEDSQEFQPEGVGDGYLGVSKTVVCCSNDSGLGR